MTYPGRARRSCDRLRDVLAAGAAAAQVREKRRGDEREKNHSHECDHRGRGPAPRVMKNEQSADEREDRNPGAERHRSEEEDGAANATAATTSTFLRRSRPALIRSNTAGTMQEERVPEIERRAADVKRQLRCPAAKDETDRRQATCRGEKREERGNGHRPQDRRCHDSTSAVNARTPRPRRASARPSDVSYAATNATAPRSARTSIFEKVPETSVGVRGPSYSR